MLILTFETLCTEPSDLMFVDSVVVTWSAFFFGAFVDLEVEALTMSVSAD